MMALNTFNERWGFRFVGVFRPVFGGGVVFVLYWVVGFGICVGFVLSVHVDDRECGHGCACCAVRVVPNLPCLGVRFLYIRCCSTVLLNIR